MTAVVVGELRLVLEWDFGSDGRSFTIGYESARVAGPQEFYVTYAFALALLGGVCLMAPRSADLPRALSQSSWLAAFAFLHAGAELLGGWQHLEHGRITPAMSADDAATHWLVPLLVLSYLPLVEAGRRTLPSLLGVRLGVWIYIPLVGALITASALSAGPLVGLDVAARVLLAAPALLLIAASLLVDAWHGRGDDAVVRGALWLAGGGLLLYVPLDGLVFEHLPGWAQALPDNVRFLAVSGVGVQLPRSLTVVLVAVSFAVIVQRLGAQAHVRRDIALRELAALNDTLEAEVTARTEALGEREAHLRQAQAVGAVGSWHCAIPADRLEWSAETYRIFDLDPNQPVDMDLVEASIHPDDREHMRTQWGRAEIGGDYDIEYRIVIDGEVRWLRDRAEFESDEQGMRISATGTLQDITQMKRATLALRASEEQYRLLVEHQTDLVVRVGVAGHFEFASPSYLDMFGIGEEDLLGKNFMPLVHEEDRASTAKAMEALAHPPHECYLEQRAMTRHGWRWLGWADKAEVDESGAIVSIFGIGRDITDRKEADARLVEAGLLMRNIIDATPDWIFVKDRQHRFVVANRAFAAGQNLAPEDMIGRTDADFWSTEYWAGDPASGTRGFHADDEDAFAGNTVHNTYDVASRADGSRRVFDTLKLPLRDRDGAIFGVLAYARDITERHETAERLATTLSELQLAHRREASAGDKARRSQGRMSALLSAMSMGILFEDRDSRVEYVNPAFCKMWSMADGIELEGQPTRDVLRHSTHQFSRQNHASRHVLQVLDTHEVSERFELDLNDGRVLTQLSYPVEDADGGSLGRLWCYEDITHERQTAQQLIYLAERDALTGLYNRHRFQERLEEMLRGAHRSAGRFALLYFDLDSFKQINDTFGHRVGDTVLVRTAGEVSTCLRTSELFARLGGDEFAVLSTIREADDVAALATRIVTAVGTVPYRFRGTNMRVTASVGVALYPEHGASAEDLVVHADTAMYQAKTRGRNTWAMYDADESPDSGLNERKIWSQRIAEAMEGEHLELHFQGIYQSSTRDLSHLEALVRMRDPQVPGRLVMPGQFVPFAERTGQIVELDRWVLRMVIEMLASRPHMPPVAVNVSGRSFDDPTLPQYVYGLLTTNAVAPSRLLIELTETAAVADIQDAQRFIEAIQHFGCSVCLDDFGSGFSSFAYLKYIEADVLKIDGLFIRDLAHNHANQVFVRAMVDVAKGLSKTTIAEFVEDAESFAMVRELGVDMAQGYHLDHPRPDHPALQASADDDG